MRIKKTSFILKYYLFSKKIIYSFFQMSDFSQSDPFSHYVFFHKIKWCYKVYTYLKIDQSQLKIHSQLTSTLKLLLNRLLVYHLWGSFLVLIFLLILGKIFDFDIPSYSLYISMGVAPIFQLLLLVGLFDIINDTFWAIIRAFKKEYYTTLHNIQKIHILEFFSLTLFLPIIALLIVLLEAIARYVVSFFHYQAIGIKLFIEFIWLFLSTIWLIFYSIFIKFSNLVKFFANRYSYREKQYKRDYYLEVQD